MGPQRASHGLFELACIGIAIFKMMLPAFAQSDAGSSTAPPPGIENGTVPPGVFAPIPGVQSVPSAPVVGAPLTGLQSPANAPAGGAPLTGLQGPTAAPPAGGQGPAAGGAVIGGPHPAAKSPDWIITPRLGIDESFTDNVRQSSSGAQGDLISIITPGINIVTDSARIKSTIDYAPQIQRYVNATDENRISHNFFDDSHYIAVPDLLFFDSHGSITQENIAGGRGFSNPNFIPASQRTQAIALSLGPTLRTDIASAATLEATYLYSRTSFTNNSSVAGPNGLSNTNQQEGRVALGTGQYSGSLRSTALIDVLHAVGSGVGSSENNVSGELDNEYEIVRTFSVIAQGGYEHLSFPNSTLNDIRGPIWGLGARYSPNPDTSVRIVYGRREGGDGFNGELRIAVTATTKIYMSGAQEIQTSQESIIQNLALSQAGPGGTVVNQNSGLPLSVVNPNFALQNDIFRTRWVQGGIINALDRNTFTLTGYYEQRTSLTGVTPNGTSTGGSFQWTREMSRQMTGSMLVGYATDSLTSGGTTNVSIGIRYIFTDTLAGGVRYDFINGPGTSATGTATPTTAKFTENAITLSLAKTF